MSQHSHVHRARYDANGDIILERDVPSPAIHIQPLQVPEPVELKPPVLKKPTPVWTVKEEPIVAPTVAAAPLPQKLVKPVTPTIEKKSESHVKILIEKSMAETGKQIKATTASAKIEFDDAKNQMQKIPNRVRGGLKKFWKAARKPVPLPMSAGRKPKTALGLFVVDTIRFGGTFALIFGVLFVSINYQSFWQIARAQLAIGADIQTEQALEHISGGVQHTTTARVPTTPNAKRNILAYLPPVGPYEDRLVIPKLGKNVPIVRPSMDALMREDWKTFEEDIQEALHDGVVHYPGSARPGQAGNVFLTGHSSYYPWDDGQYKDVFARLPEMEIGDTYSVFYGGDKHTYRIFKKFEVRPNDVTVLDQPSDRRMATLMTCTPIGTTLRRLILQAEEIDPTTGLALKVGEKVDESTIAPLGRLNALPI